MAANVKNMTSGAPGKLILLFALPLMLGNVFQQFYTMVDAMVVGQVVGVEALAAVGAADWLIWMIQGILTGGTQGFSILTAQNYGAGDGKALKKTVAMSYVLTAVLSPRTDEGFVRWRNTLHDEDLDAEDNSFVKSLNECFHGTSCFQPGVYGYQQHMWSAALSGEAVVFANHPGTTCEEAELRPGYWNGNGIMPAVSVQKGMIGAVYSVPDDHPIAFTHLYIPFDRFARSVVDGHWIFLAEGKGQLGIWTSCRGEPYEDEMASSELRFMARKTAYLVVAGRAEEQTFEGFMSKLKHMDVSFSEERLSLEVDGELFVVFRGVDDWSQYLE